MVKRYYCSNMIGECEVPHEDGDFVEYTDYAALAERCERLEGAADKALKAMNIIWKLKDRDDDYIYDEMGSQLSGGYFALRDALSGSSGGKDG
jgi:hypothetical protein